MFPCSFEHPILHADGRGSSLGFPEPLPGVLTVTFAEIGDSRSSDLALPLPVGVGDVFDAEEADFIFL